MDNLLKERIVGAVVLVLAAVVFIPVVLDGPDSTAKVTRSVTLPSLGDGTDDDRETVRIDLDSNDVSGIPPAVTRQEPVSIDLTEAEKDTGAAASPPAVAQDEPVPSPAPGVPAETQEAPEITGIQPWTVQIGSFSNDSNAEKLAAELRELGFPAYVSRFDDGGTVHHRVRVGGFASRDAAQAKADEIRAGTGQPARPARNL